MKIPNHQQKPLAYRTELSTTCRDKTSTNWIILTYTVHTLHFCPCLLSLSARRVQYALTFPAQYDCIHVLGLFPFHYFTGLWYYLPWCEFLTRHVKIHSSWMTNRKLKRGEKITYRCLQVSLWSWLKLYLFPKKLKTSVHVRKEAQAIASQVLALNKSVS